MWLLCFYCYCASWYNAVFFTLSKPKQIDLLYSTADDYLLSMPHLIRLILSRDQICRDMRDRAFLGNQLWFLLQFFRDVIIIFSDWRHRSNASRHCDVFSDASVGRTSSYDEKIFLRYRSFIRACFFPTNALTQRAKSFARDSFWKKISRTSKKNRHHDRRKFYDGALISNCLTAPDSSKEEIRGIIKVDICRPSPYKFLSAASYYKTPGRNLFAFSGAERNIY